MLEEMQALQRKLMLVEASMSGAQKERLEVRRGHKPCVAEPLCASEGDGNIYSFADAIFDICSNSLSFVTTHTMRNCCRKTYSNSIY